MKHRTSPLLLAGLLFISMTAFQAAFGANFDKTFLNQHLSAYPSRGFEWENNSIGITDKAPAPWHPVRRQGRTVAVSGRTIEFGDNTAFIRQITSLGQPLLTDGIALRLVTGDDTVHHLVCDLKPTRQTDAAVTFRGDRKLSGGHVAVECLVEFDGFIHVSIDFTGTPKLTIKELQLVTGLPSAAAPCYKIFAPYDFATEEFGGSGKMETTGALSRELRLSFVPVMSLFNEWVGLEFMCETDFEWSLQKPVDAVRVTTGKEGVCWTIQMINQPVTFAGAKHLAFALYPLPTRPSPFAGFDADTVIVNSSPVLDFKKGLAPWHTVYGVHRNVKPLRGAPRNRTELLSAELLHFGMNTPHPSGREQRRYVKDRAEMAKDGIRYLPYTILHGLPTDLPSETVTVDRAHLDSWLLKRAKEVHDYYVYAGFHHKSLIDFRLFHELKTIRDHKLDGQYFDLAQPRAADAYARRRTENFDAAKFYMPLFGYREFSKRFYIATKELNPSFLIVQHAVVPTGISAAYSVASGGEHLKKHFAPEGSGGKTHRTAADGSSQLQIRIEEYAPDYFLIPELMFPKGNFWPVFGQTLSFSDIRKGTGDYFREHPDKLVFYCRTFLARALVHNVPIWIRSLDMDAALKVFQALDKFGPREQATRFISATDPKTLLTDADKAPFEYCVHTRDGVLLLIVSNNRPEPRTAHFDLTPLIGKQTWHFTNAETSEPIPSANGTLAILITKRDFRIVLGRR